MKITINDKFNNRNSKTPDKQMKFEGECVIRNYTGKPSGAGNITINIGTDEVTLQRGQQPPKANRIIEFNKTKYDVFTTIAKCDRSMNKEGKVIDAFGDIFTRSDLEKAQKNFNAQNKMGKELKSKGVTGISFKDGVFTVSIKGNELLRFEYKKSEKQSPKTSADKPAQKAGTATQKTNTQKSKTTAADTKSKQKCKQEKKVNVPKTNKVKPKQKIRTGNHEAFLNHLGERESSNNYSKINPYGYLGKYQMGEMALVDAGYINPKKHYDNTWRSVSFTKYAESKGITSPQKFLKSKSAQEDAQIRYKKAQWRALKNKKATKYLGKSVKGIKITEGALLGGAHLKGPDNVMLFLESGGKIDPRDKNGTPVSEYMELFCGYNVKAITNGV